MVITNHEPASSNTSHKNSLWSWPKKNKHNRTLSPHNTRGTASSQCSLAEKQQKQIETRNTKGMSWNSTHTHTHTYITRIELLQKKDTCINNRFAQPARTTRHTQQSWQLHSRCCAYAFVGTLTSPKRIQVDSLLHHTGSKQTHSTKRYSYKTHRQC